MGAATSRWDVAQRPTEPAGETKPQDLPGLQGAQPLPSHTSKKEGTDVPLLGCHRARGFCLWKGQAQCLRARSRGYLLRSVRPVRCTFFSGCAG